MRMAFGMALAAAALVAGCADSGPWGGPFGTKKGITPDQLSASSKLVEDRLGGDYKVYSSKQAPRPSSEVSEYAYKFGDEVGLCSVSGLIDGGSLDAVVKGVTERYGSPVSLEKGLLAWGASTHVMTDDLAEIEVIGLTPDYSMIVYVYSKGDDCH